MMKLWMYGAADRYQPDTAAGVLQLKRLGFSSVAGGIETARAGYEAGLDAYIAAGAYRSPDFTDDSWLAEDPRGNKRHWFSSTCPTRKEVREYNLSIIRKYAAAPGIKGIIIDGVRFASPSSGEGTDGTDAFFTCFCPSCMAKAKAMGFDSDEIRSAAAALMDYLHGKSVKIEYYLYGLYEWMEFRRAATTEHLIDFCKTVKSVNPVLQTGIFIFTPALSGLVGQSYRDLIPYMDIFSPMIYRCYPAENGPSCLNIELSDMLKMLEGSRSLDTDSRIRLLIGLTGIDLKKYENPAAIRQGLDIHVIREETYRARMQAGRRRLVPIIQLDDPSLEQAIDECMKGGADEVNFLSYSQSLLEKHADMLERLAHRT